MDSTFKRTRSVSPVMENTDDSFSADSSSVADRVTRSHSVEMFETIDNTDNKKRKLKTSHESPNSKKADSRNQRNKKETKKMQRDIVKKQRLEELDQVERAIKDGSHVEYHRLLQNAENKRARMLNIIEAKRVNAEKSVIRFFSSQKDIAYSQYYWDKLSLRRSMTQYTQQQISKLEQEYYLNHVQNSLDEEHLVDWSPPERPTMISSLTLGLSEETAENDVELAKQDPFTEHHSRESSPPLDMLASLADRQYQKDFKQEKTPTSTYRALRPQATPQATTQQPPQQHQQQQHHHPYYY